MKSLPSPQRRSTDLEPPGEGLRSVQHEVAQLRQELRLARALKEANERLVVSAMEAETLADSAFSQLEDLSRTASTDPLTGTPNRTTMRDRVETAIGLARRHSGRLAVLFVDLDGFKTINDAHGHALGDVALITAAKRMKAVVRDSDTVSRHGGDEFLVLLSEITLPNDAGVIATEILESLLRPIDQCPFRLGASLGIAIYPEDGHDAASLIAHADTAMYAAKRAGGSRFEFFGDHPDSSPHEGADTGRRAPELPRTGRDDEPPDAGNLREANQKLVIAALAAQEAEAHGEEVRRRHEKFVSMVAHELRAPLMPLSSCAELLLHAGRDEVSLGRVQGIIKRQVAHLARMVDDLLEGSRVTGSKFRLNLRDVELAHIIESSIDICRARVSSRGQDLVVTAAQHPALLVEGDTARLVQVFGNLLDNASKYTPTGGTIWLTVESDPVWIAVTISDNGIGIDGDVLTRIFDLFVQDPRAIDVDAGGLGIGLAVVLDLVQAHKGTIVASSAGPGHGSEFRVRLPRVQAGPVDPVVP